MRNPIGAVECIGESKVVSIPNFRVPTRLVPLDLAGCDLLAGWQWMCFITLSVWKFALGGWGSRRRSGLRIRKATKDAGQHRLAYGDLVSNSSAEFPCE